MARIHPNAVIDAAAKIADDVEIGPFCVVGPNVSIGAGSRLISHVSIMGRTAIGDRNTIFPFASLGSPPHSLGYKNEPTELVIGSDNIIRESVTMNVGTVGGGGVTRVGSHGFFMAYAHVAHDCIVGDNVIFANNATLAGHCEIGDHVFIGGLSAIHQFTRIGAYAMIGGCSGISSDVIPFGMASGERARMIGINTIGMKRRGFSTESVQAMRTSYRQLFLSAPTLDEGLNTLSREHGDDPAVRAVIDFVTNRGKRNLCRPGG